MKAVQSFETEDKSQIVKLIHQIKQLELKNFDNENEVDRQQIENQALLDRNKELNQDIEVLHSKFKSKETEMHGEQTGWINKYHDQIDRMTNLEKLNADRIERAEEKY